MKSKVALAVREWLKAGIVAAVTAVALWQLQDHGVINLDTVYPALRGSLFTGFFTISGFLLTLKNLILTGVRTGVYEAPEYRARHLKSEIAHQSLYVPLRNLGALIHYSILSCLVASFAQLTIGLVLKPWAAITCLALAAAAATLLLTCLAHLRDNLLTLFDQLDEGWEKRQAAEAAAAATAPPAPRA